ncbi:hypothetical protein C1645_738418 [Glomus cerebriforme]|uniref:Uncharacterized protein n=1 Tax=Glomus cerebriforme TaxID=658196 RepID=A0A397SUS9_9GLOM|nr:hypothetical protein C1645_738418 [Glomus cerebriforme]
MKKQNLNSGSFAAFKFNNSSSSATPTSNDQSEHNIAHEFGPSTSTSHSTILPVLLTAQTTSGPVHVKVSMPSGLHGDNPEVVMQDQDDDLLNQDDHVNPTPISLSPSIKDCYCCV